MARILVVAAHPQMQHSRVTRALMKAATALAAAGGSLGAGGARPAIEVIDLYACYPDYLIDVPDEQARLAAADLVVWLHPTQWYSMPPLMKLWLDEVFAFGWAYGPGGHALRGKSLWLVTSTGGTEEAYRPDGHNRYFFDAFLHPHEQTAALCGMKWMPPLVLHGAHRIGAPALEAHARLWTERLQSWPAWPELADAEDLPECAVPEDARPAAEPAGP
jgi:glutathione-regulated potassium-efflux system ancillary protein KefF